MWKYKLADIDYDRKELQAVQTVLKSKWLSMGPVTKHFERNFADFLGIYIDINEPQSAYKYFRFT